MMNDDEYEGRWIGFAVRRAARRTSVFLMRIRVDVSCRRIAAFCLTLALAGCSGSSNVPSSVTQPPPGNPVGPNLSQISSDPFTVGPGQHSTEVEPHVLAFGATEVAAFQTGRIFGGGGTAIGWATSTDSGNTWTHGFLPGLTSGNGGGPYSAASDPAVAFDA